MKLIISFVKKIIMDLARYIAVILPLVVFLGILIYAWRYGKKMRNS